MTPDEYADLADLPAQRILFPVLLGGPRVWRNAKLLVYPGDPGAVLVAIATGGRTVEVVDRISVAGVVTYNQYGARWYDTEGMFWQAENTGGCGCGSPLVGWTPATGGVQLMGRRG